MPVQNVYGASPGGASSEVQTAALQVRAELEGSVRQTEPEELVHTTPRPTLVQLLPADPWLGQPPDEAQDEVAPVEMVRELWASRPADLHGTPPSGRDLHQRLETPEERVSATFGRLRAYVHPPQTGHYRFWVDGSHSCQLFLSTDDSPERAEQIARVQEGEKQQAFDPQSSILIKLTAGEKYYIEARQASAGGVGRCVVAWEPPKGDRTVIDGEYLSPYGRR
jgi:hypothetical protein